MSNSKPKIKVMAINMIIRVANKLLSRQSGKSSDRYLVVSSTGVGDTLWGTPAIRAMRCANPAAYIAVLTNGLGRELLMHNPSIDDIFIFRRGLSGIVKLPALVSSLRKKRFDKIFIFHASDRLIWPICHLAGAREIWGFGGQSKGMDHLLTNTVEPDTSAHGVRNRFIMLEKNGISEGDQQLELYLSHKDEDAAADFLHERGISDSEIIVGLHPGAQKPFKCWPADNYIDIANQLVRKYSCRIVITGNEQEVQLAQRVAGLVEGAVSAAGQLPLLGTAALIKRMALFVTNDTGPMHMAFALKRPTIALFCPTDPALCGPYKAIDAVVINKPVTCSPCAGKKCYNPVCLEQIRSQEVIGEAGLVLSRHK